MNTSVMPMSVNVLGARFIPYSLTFGRSLGWWRATRMPLF